MSTQDDDSSADTEVDRELLTMAGRFGVPINEETLPHLVRLLAASRDLPPDSMATATERVDLDSVRSPPGIWGHLGRFELHEAPRPGELVEARDRELLRDVLLRLANPGEEEQLLERLRLHARVEHPNVSPLHDIVAVDLLHEDARRMGLAPAPASHQESGAPTHVRVVFSIEEKQIEGWTIGDLLEAPPAESEDERSSRRTEVLIHLREVAGALARAHEMGISRGGLSDQSVLIGTYGEVSVLGWDRAVAIDRSPGALPAVRRDLDDLVGLLQRAVGSDRQGKFSSERIPEDLLHGVMAVRRGAGTAREVAAAISAHLERAAEVDRRMRAAQRELELGREAMSLWFSSSQRVGKLNMELVQFGGSPIDAGADRDRFQRARALEEERDHLATTAAESRAEAMRHFRTALRHDSGLVEARDALAAVHWEYLEEAEAWGLADEARLHKQAVERFDSGSRISWLNDPGRLEVVSRPSGARVQIWRYSPTYGGRVLVAELVRDLGFTPSAVTTLPQDSYLLIVELEDHAPLRHPVVVGHGFDERVELELLPTSEVPANMVHVHAGPFLAGGDLDQVQQGVFREVQLPGFLIGKTQVTCGEYLDYLNQLGRGDPDQAELRQPRRGAEQTPVWESDEQGRYRLPTKITDPRCPWEPNLPIVGISYEDAIAYLHWLAMESGRSFQLPHDLAIQKASRGADGRLFPWGSHPDATLANTSGHLGVEERLLPVGSVLSDSSPYGVFDLAGNAQDYVVGSRDGSRPGAALVTGSCFQFDSYLARSTLVRVVEPKMPGQFYSFRRFITLD